MHAPQHTVYMCIQSYVYKYMCIPLAESSALMLCLFQVLLEPANAEDGIYHPHEYTAYTHETKTLRPF